MGEQGPQRPRLTLPAQLTEVETCAFRAGALFGLHGRLTRKYDIRKADGSPTDPNAQYFVLRIDEDLNARQALVAYAASVRPVNLQFSDDLLIWLRDVMDEGQIGTGDEWDDLFQGVRFTAGLLGHAVAGDPVGRPAPEEPAVELPPADGDGDGATS